MRDILNTWFVPLVCLWHIIIIIIIIMRVALPISTLITDRRKIHELLFTASSKTSLSWKLKNFYDSCMNLDIINSVTDQPLRKVINLLGEFSCIFGPCTHHVHPGYFVGEVARRLPDSSIFPLSYFFSFSKSWRQRQSQIFLVELRGVC